VNKVVRILGIRGVPAAHGGFETFAERLALYLVDRGWRVVVYCQEEGLGDIRYDKWKGVERVIIPVRGDGSVSSVVFDWHATRHASKFRDLCLTLGYNTAVFTALLRVRGLKNLINMDGIEWSRAKWGAVAKAWFWTNERLGCLLGTHLVADHPEIKRHLATRISAGKITVIAYGADRLTAMKALQGELACLANERYLTVIARPEPENSLLEIVSAFSAKPRGMKLVVLGKYDRAIPYHCDVLDAASSEVMFVGAIYDREVVGALRAGSVAYVHGHRVGGTNPSLVESMGAGNAVIAHDNRFNRWVVGDGAQYFADEAELVRLFDSLLGDASVLSLLSVSAQARFEEFFTWDRILGQYEQLLEHHAGA